jgi:Flp pilus assembly protein TadD
MHQESLNNLGVLELKRDKKGEARDLFTSAQVSDAFL